VLKRQPGDPKPKSGAPAGVNAGPSASGSSSGEAGMGVGLYAILLIGGALAYGAYQYLQAQQGKNK
jgi:cytochrome b5